MQRGAHRRSRVPARSQEATGTYQVGAKYAGDGNYGAASGTATEVVNESATSLAVTSSTLVFGDEQQTSFSVTITWPPEPASAPAPPATSTAAIMAGKQTVCTAPLAITEVSYVNPAGDPGEYPEYAGSCAPDPGELPAGTYSTLAVFSGATGLFVGSSSTPAPLTVRSAPTETTLSVSRSTTTYENESSEALTAMVSQPGVGSSYVTGSAH